MNSSGKGEEMRLSPFNSSSLNVLLIQIQGLIEDNFARTFKHHTVGKDKKAFIKSICRDKNRSRVVKHDELGWGAQSLIL